MAELELIKNEENPNEIKELLNQLDTFGMDEDSASQFMTILELEDDKFKIIADQLIMQTKAELNNPHNVLQLVTAANLGNIKEEDLVNLCANMVLELKKADTGISDIKIDFITEYLGLFINAIQQSRGVNRRIIQIPFKKLHPDAITPTYAHDGDAGADIYSLEDYTIKPGETVLIKTGIACALPPGYEFEVRPKSGISLKTKLRVANSPGTIDSNYRGEIGVIMENILPDAKEIEYHFTETRKKPVIDSILHGESYTIEKGQKIAQLVLKEVPRAAFFEVEELNETDRGDGGYGSTGLK